MKHAIRHSRPVLIGTCAFIMLTSASCDSTNDSASPGAAPPPASPAAEPTAVSFDTVNITFVTSTDSVQMQAELAERPDQRAFGLMDRDALPAEAGMVFLYDDIQSGDTGFWMYRTRIPLDIAYFDGAGTIVAIQQMMPCRSLDPNQCGGYAAGVPYYGAVEANRGYFARNGISTGDRVIIPGRIGG
ncbi:MAG TPA: DUF192 domain-containing protein [Longimicrobiales bacterium]|nr:DUF192 domain-containing protein [Longimicrobiales bacterium]